MSTQGKRKPLTHGTLSGYQHYKCRCNKCRAVKLAYEKKLKEQKGLKKPELVGPKPIAHGTSNSYQYYGCRCEICSAFMRGYRLGSKCESALQVKPEGELTPVIQIKSEEYERQRTCGSAEAYSFGCTCELCMTEGRSQYLKMVVV
ncbi:hypothetical protein [uncultured Acinetobacter sp.]|uniref:hypothetical protein n=1 Tax=uncultured Acinetobacter sp. TaxID=165433 RepID=UPI0025907430|nr:hypothetical protein [uncultured Acinetobacter sp.]